MRESREFSLYLSRFLIVHFNESSGAVRKMFLIIMQLAADKLQILLQNSVFNRKVYDGDHDALHPP